VVPADVLPCLPAALNAANEHPPPPYKEHVMSLGTILLIVLILLLIGAIPSWPHSRSWGYMPSGSIGLIVVIVLVLVMTGRL
jgi:hypothetical protein